MKKYIQKHLRVTLALFIVSIVFVGFAIVKQEKGLFLDEIYSYGLSNSYYAPYINSLFDNSNMIDKVITREDFQSYLSVDKGQQFDWGSVYFNQVKDVHPPLFYIVLHTVSSFFPGVISKWYGLAINFICMIFCNILLYKMCIKLFDSKRLAVFAIYLYGLSTIGIETFMMIRMYSMLTVFTVGLAYIISCLLENKKTILYIFLFADIFLGLLTQYYFVFYAFFICLLYFIYSLKKGEYRNAILFTIGALGGALLFAIIFPSFFSHLFDNGIVSGNSAVQKLKDIENYFRIIIYIKMVVIELAGAVFLALIAGVFCIFSIKKRRLVVKKETVRTNGIIVVAPAFLTLIFVSIISPYNAIRYVYNVSPIFVVAAIYLCYLCKQIINTDNNFFSKIDILISINIIISILLLVVVPPKYVCTIDKSCDYIISKYKNYPCIYFTNNFNGSLTQDMLQLMQFDTVLVCNDPNSKAINKYISECKKQDECIVYFDISEFSASGYKPDEMFPQFIENTGFLEIKLLYKHDRSAAYIVR